MKILNKESLDTWMNERMKMGRDMKAIKGVLEGATYSDGDPVTTPMNVAWQDLTSGEIFSIEYDI